jgi:hypothetical protein
MKGASRAEEKRDIMLSSSQDLPFHFTVLINDAWPLHDETCFVTVKGTHLENGAAKTTTYILDNQTHKEYLRFYEKLAVDYGLRKPQNSLPVKQASINTPYEPILTENCAPGILYGYGDPALIRTVGSDGASPVYYVVVTSNDAPDSFPILSSENLVDWNFVGYVFPKGQKPTWAADGEGISDYWAPEMHLVGNEYRLYFVARDKDSLELCIGLARSNKPDGPFIADDHPILKGNVIDPHIFVQHDCAYLFWKEDNNEVWPRCLLDFLYQHPEQVTQLFNENANQITASFIITLWPWARMRDPMKRFQAIQIFIEAITSDYTKFYNALTELSNRSAENMRNEIQNILKYMKTPMFAQALSADGSSLIGERTKIIENDLEWEAHLIEGMWVTKQNNQYYLFYAGNDFSTSQYGIGVAMAKSLMGPYKKANIQLLQSTDTWWAPGHPSLVMDTEGKPRLFLHAYFPGNAGYKIFRALLSIPLLFKEDEVMIANNN